MLRSCMFSFIFVVRKAFDNGSWCLGVPLRISVIVVDDDYIFVVRIFVVRKAFNKAELSLLP